MADKFNLNHIKHHAFSYKLNGNTMKHCLGLKVFNRTHQFIQSPYPKCINVHIRSSIIAHNTRCALIPRSPEQS